VNKTHEHQAGQLQVAKQARSPSKRHFLRKYAKYPGKFRRQFYSLILCHSPPTLYERLGGVYPIATVVDDFIDRIMVDPRLNANPLVDEAHHRVSPPGFKYLVTEMVCWASGGPQKYTGRSMFESHKDLKITGGEWDAFMDDFQQTLDKFGVPAPEQGELKTIVDSARADIVVEPEAAATS
jgi:hemoglobin